MRTATRLDPDQARRQLREELSTFTRDSVLRPFTTPCSFT